MSELEQLKSQIQIKDGIIAALQAKLIFAERFSKDIRLLNNFFRDSRSVDTWNSIVSNVIAFEKLEAFKIDVEATSGKVTTSE